MSEALSRVLRAWPLLTLLALAAVFTLMLLFSRKAPLIASLEPAMAAPGQTVVLTGDYFGRTPREGSLSIAGEIPPPSLIRSWSDQKIVFDVPSDAASGLVTVSNTQGTSQGVLFTNTVAIPTVLQTAAAPGLPLVIGAVPARPASGQTVTITGRGFGSGADGVLLRLGAGVAVLELKPQDTLAWTERAVSFVLPAGVDGETSLRVVTPRGESPPYTLLASSPLSYSDPRTVTVEFRARATVARPAVVRGPVPRVADTRWTADGPTSASWPAGTRDLRYRLTLTTWAKTAATLAPPSVPPPAFDTASADLWKPAAASLKTFTASWGLETADSALKLQRLSAGLAAFAREVGQREKAALGTDPQSLLALRRLNSFETASLAAYLGGQAGLAVRPVTGLWLNENGVLLARTWTEVWLAGGWIPWDPVDGTPGRLDNRHFAFAASSAPFERRLARSVTWGRPAPATLGDPSGEMVAPASASDAEPIVRWEFTRVEK